MNTIAAILKSAQQSVAAQPGLPPDEAKLEARLLLQTILGVNHAWLLAHEGDALDASALAGFNALLKRRLAGEPIAHILGKREFYGLELRVTPDTLIPRPNTETLVEAALDKIPGHRPVSVLDLGTGTGAVALAIAKNRPQAFVTAVDVSQTALDVAAGNAKNLGIGNVRLVLSDWFSALGGELFDAIAGNPPYIGQDDEHLGQGDLRFEPRSALASGRDGLDDIRRIVASAPQYLKPHGWLLLEHGYDQAGRVAELLKKAGFGEVGSVPDLAGIPRVTSGRLG